MKKIFWALPLMGFAAVAQAHTGHAHLSLMDGLAHPFGFDHLLAMVAVGLWSARVLQGRTQLFGPLLFVLSLVTGALTAQVAGFEWAMVEYLIAASIVAFALLIAVPKVSKGLGFALIIAAGCVHGWAHGAEATAGGVFAMYALGFVLTTVVLHLSGVFAGQQLLRLKAAWHWRTISAVMAGYGVYALSMLG